MTKHNQSSYPYRDTKHVCYTEVWLCFGSDNTTHGTRIRLGGIPNDQTHSYLDKLNAFMPQPGACMQYHFYFILHSHPFKANDKMWLRQTLFIVPVNVYPGKVKFLCGAKNGHECLGNVICGKCVDPFVRENIGKVFYKKNYSKQKD